MGIGLRRLHPSYARIYFEIVGCVESFGLSQDKLRDTHRLSESAEKGKKELEMFTLRDV